VAFVFGPADDFKGIENFYICLGTLAINGSGNRSKNKIGADNADGSDSGRKVQPIASQDADGC